jgi:hypothetical protein
MRRFFLLGEDSRLRGVHAVVPNYPVLGPFYFDSAQVLKCLRVPDDCLMAEQLVEKPGKKVDLVGNPLGWAIVSPAMLRVFEEFARENIQALPLNVIDSSGTPVLTDYRVVNVLRCLDQTVDLEHSVTSRHTIGDKETLYIITPVFRVDTIPQDIHVFRPVESLFHLVVSQEFAEALQKTKLKGFALVQTESI